jgi:type IV secretory pathway VirB3-like protein
MTSDRETHRVYKALHRPLTVWGVDRRLFFLALMMGAAMFNLFYSFLAALLTFASFMRDRTVVDQTRPADAAHSVVVVAFHAV